MSYFREIYLFHKFIIVVEYVQVRVMASNEEDLHTEIRICMTSLDNSKQDAVMAVTQELVL